MLRTWLAVLAVTAVLAVSPAHAQMKEINFGIISTESMSNLKPQWEPLLADMQKLTGIKVNAFYAPDYAGVIEGMRFNKVQVAWFGNKSAMEAVDRAGGEIFAQSVDKDGVQGYWSLLIVHKDSPLNSLEDLIKSPGKYTFGNGDPNSTSGFLVPSYYVFAQHNIDPRKHFTRVVNANHETNALSVINKQVDVATNNTEQMARVERADPAKRAQIKIIWKSPLIPADPIVWRKDLDQETKARLKGFFLAYGRLGPDAAHQREVLAKLLWSPFTDSSNDQLLPIRQLELVKDRRKIESDTRLSDAEKRSKLKAIDDKLDALNQAMMRIAAK